MMNNPLQMMNEFKKFMQSGITPQKAEQIVMEKLNSGAISHEQFENLKTQAQQIQNILGFFK